ncbi:esterase/lipase family protein [Nocardia puris]|uniref:Triacylglycerol esterase/lipase EstA (Alpha/beta hydrolase family) n=1 Tax=Nocardia puris TaxID=208602 RepID=A0A366D9H5_9NOCA|nr:alpha/beta fold hydrolase [Nocardia puris]RBO86595.1 triacylglycerol esterase/lipase EstA (alpha/beta hydrolase family) [Nocardia puris]
MFATTQRARRGLACAAMIAGLALPHGLGSGVAAGAPQADSEPALTAFADTLSAGLMPAADGRQPKAIVDTGSASGSASGSGWAKSTASAAVGEGPELTAALAAFAHGLLNPDAAPQGANRWDCKPTAQRPRPVVLLHGTWLNAFDTFSYMSPQLARAGYCVFAFNFGRSGLLEGGGLGTVLPGRYGVGPMEESSRQLAEFVERVRAATGAEQVDIVGHSQGGTVANRYLKLEGGAGKVGKLITFGATHHGTSLMGIATLGRVINNLGVNILGFYEPIVGISNIQQAHGSAFYAELNAGGDTVPGVEYTAVGSRYDEVTNPYDWTFLQAGPGATVHNITLQAGCEQDFSDHLTMMYSPRSVSIALNALDPATHPALDCAFNPWLVGGGGRL